MHITTFEPGGKTKRIERVLSVNCQVCGASLQCPPDTDFWFWTSSPAVAEFRREHEAHGSPRLVGAEIKTIELETE